MKNFFKGVVKIGGKIFEGSNIQISNSEIIIDGKKIDREKSDFNITVEGNIQTLRVDYCNSIKISGSVDSVDTMSADVHCGDVRGSVSTMSGDITASIINGSASTMSGDISGRK